MDTLDNYQRDRRTIFHPKSDGAAPDAEWRRARAGKASFSPTDAEAAGLAETVLERPVSFVERLPHSATAHRLWAVESEGERLILRMNALPEHIADYAMIVEAAVSDRLTERDFPVPEVRCVDLSRSRIDSDFILETEAPGLPLVNVDDDERLLMPLLRDLGRRMADLHAEKLGAGFGWIQIDAKDPLGHRRPFRGMADSWAGYLETCFERHLSRCVQLKAIEMAEAERIEAWFRRLEPVFAGAPSSLLHNDLHGTNVFTNGRRISALIDWEDCLLGDPLFDAAGWACFNPSRRHPAFLAGYFSSKPRPADFGPRFWFYFTRIALARTVSRERLGIVDKPGRPPAAGRIRMGLNELDKWNVPTRMAG